MGPYRIPKVWSALVILNWFTQVSKMFSSSLQMSEGLSLEYKSRSFLWKLSTSQAGDRFNKRLILGLLGSNANCLGSIWFGIYYFDIGVNKTAILSDPSRLLTLLWYNYYLALLILAHAILLHLSKFCLSCWSRSKMFR